jgi:hypothetical protein
MPSERIASDIKGSLTPGEKFEDFAYMFDALMLLRAPYNQDLSLSERIVSRIECIIFPDKPPKYIRALRQFRLSFVGVAFNPERQAEFSNSVRHAAIMVSRVEDIVFRPSLYFTLPPRLRELKELREWWF